MLTFNEYWLLDVAREVRPTLYSTFGPQRFLHDQWMKRPHTMSQEEVVDVLYGLYRRGLIAPYRCTTARYHSLADWAPTMEELLQAFVIAHTDGVDRFIQRQHGYSLTPAGGAAWEEHVHADWRRFFSEEWKYDVAPLEVAVTAGSEARRENVVLEAPLVHWGGKIVGPISRYTVKPFQATYWKTLDEGFAFRADFTNDPDDFSADELKARRRLRDQETYTHLNCAFLKWHDGELR